VKYPRRERSRREVRVSASQLAQMGVCERLVVFEHRYGKRPSRPQRVALERGRRAHQSFLLQASPNSKSAWGGDVFSIVIRFVLASVRHCTRPCRMAWRYLRATMS
jgi:hypothetical protein